MVSEQRRLRVVALGLVGSVLAAAAIEAAHLGQHASSSTASGTAYGTDYGSGWSPTIDPFVGGQTVTLAQAQAQAPFRLYRPNDALASDGSIQNVWIASSSLDGAQPSPDVLVAIGYTSGVMITIEPIDHGPAATPPVSQTAVASNDQQVAATYNGGATEQTVDGVPAVVGTQNTDASGGNPGFVDLSLPHGGTSFNDVNVVVYGHFSTADLVRVANTLQ